MRTHSNSAPVSPVVLGLALSLALVPGCGGGSGSAPSGPPYEPPAVAFALGAADDAQSYFIPGTSVLSSVALREGHPSGRLGLELGYRTDLFAYAVHQCATDTPRDWTSCGLLGNGDGTLAPCAYALALDLDGDGLRDDAAIVLENSSTTNGNGVVHGEQATSGGFVGFLGSSMQIPLGTTPTGACVLDMDGDDVDDVAYAVGAAGTVAVVRSTPTPTAGPDPTPSFALTEWGSVPLLYPTDVAGIDLTGDGDDELAVLDVEVGRVRVFDRVPPGSLSALAPVLSGVTPGAQLSALVAGDFDGDGRTDLGAFEDQIGGGRFVTFRSRGDGTFAAPKPTARTTGGLFVPTRATVGDLNGDGRLDVAWISLNDFRLGVLLGRGDGTFVEASDPSLTGASPTDVAVGDVDADGFVDVVVSLAGPGRVDIWYGAAP